MNALGNEKELVQNKLILLYILRRLDMAVTNRQLTELVLSHRLMNYFIMQQMLLELIKSGYIDAQIDENREQIKISVSGVNTLEYFLNMIPSYVKLKIDTKVLPDSLIDKLTSYTTAEFYPVGIKQFKVILESDDLTGKGMKICISTDDSAFAKNLVNLWNEKSDQIRDRILDMLKENT